MISIASETFDSELPIPGLCFRPNCVRELNSYESWFSMKVNSSPGPLISDFVTHGRDFEYSTYGIHVGQDDRLTFLGSLERQIVGHFIDCRKGSSTLHLVVKCSFAPSPYRRLIIPRGVAHTFDNLDGIVTRDEPIWYSSENNPHWNVNNDLISILRTEASFPAVDVNEYRLPDDFHVYMSRLSQAVLDKPKPYSTRFNLLIGGEEKYVMFQESTWENEGHTLQPLIDAVQGSGISAHRSKYAITGKASWTLVPNTGAGVADILYLGVSDQESSPQMFVHRRTRKWYTFLTGEGTHLQIEVLDLRPSSPQFGSFYTYHTICDPRVSYLIEPGIAYCFLVNAAIYVRSENEVFVSDDEPREDLPSFGQDLEVVEPNSFSLNQPPLPTLRCPDQVIRQMARFELQF